MLPMVIRTVFDLNLYLLCIEKSGFSEEHFYCFEYDVKWKL